jgi:putative ABC transport system permease protein
VVILSDGLWRRRFGGDRDVIGRQLTIDDNSYTVIGVAPGGFENALAPSSEIWAPLQYDPLLPPEGREWGHHLRMVGCLREGVGSRQAEREIAQMARAPVPEFSRPPHASLGQGLSVTALRDDVTSGVKPALLAVLGAVLLLLMIACVNVTNLLLARGAQRRGEFAVRAALGAGQTRLVRQLLTESLLLSLLGGALGMLVAFYGVRGLVALSPAGLARVGAIRIDGAVYAFAIGLTTLIGVAVGLLPALHASGGDLRDKIQQASGRSAGGRQWTRRMLVVTEVALAFVLLVGGGLLFNSLRRLFSIDPGFNPSRLLTMQVQVSGRRFDPGATHRFFARALEAARQVPGVTGAAFTSQLPLSGETEDGYGVHFESTPTNKPDADDGALRYAVSPGYFETMAIPLRRGRLLDRRDVENAPLAVVVSESLAKGKFPNQDPIGQRLRVGPSDGPWYSIVGVVGDVKQTSLAASQTDAVYVTHEQWGLFADRALWLMVRTTGDAAALAPAIRQAVWSVDKDQPIIRVATMDNLLAATAAERRFALILFEAFGLVALALSAVGLYGVLSGSVSERTREIGVRLALGAQRRDVLRLILRQGARLTLYGVGLGLIVALMVTRLMSKLLYGVTATDPFTFGAVALLLTAVALFACYLPARRAARVDPLTALRQE